MPQSSEGPPTTQRILHGVELVLQATVRGGRRVKSGFSEEGSLTKRPEPKGRSANTIVGLGSIRVPSPNSDCTVRP
jgi:hypothetical protein